MRCRRATPKLTVASHGEWISSTTDAATAGERSTAKQSSSYSTPKKKGMKSAVLCLGVMRLTDDSNEGSENGLDWLPFSGRCIALEEADDDDDERVVSFEI